MKVNKFKHLAKKVIISITQTLRYGYCSENRNIHVQKMKHCMFRKVNAQCSKIETFQLKQKSLFLNRPWLHYCQQPFRPATRLSEPHFKEILDKNKFFEIFKKTPQVKNNLGKVKDQNLSGFSTNSYIIAEQSGICFNSAIRKIQRPIGVNFNSMGVQCGYFLIKSKEIPYASW